jgi:prepilin-type N-terminal cleavage/methylation domain-containing protein
MHPATHRSHRSAFSLVELSIVLVILGLLVGGVLSGQSLIRSAELRSITSEYQRYAAATGTFRDKYFALPGDMSNASSFWGGAGNGDGNGQINNTATAGTNEISTFWMHLSSAAMIEGSYTNIAYGAMTAGTHNPRAKMNNGAWNVIGLGSVTVAGVQSYTNSTGPAASTFFSGNYGNAFTFGSGTSAILPGTILRPEEAWNIDTKMDDGRPDIGSVTTLESQGATAGTGCSSLDTSTSALAASTFSLANGTQLCSMVFKSGY